MLGDEEVQESDCVHDGIECEPDDCRCYCDECSDARLDYENEVQD
jgi:hypothetical protein